MEDFKNTDKTLNMLRNTFRLTGDVEVFMQIVALENEKKNIINKEQDNEVAVNQDDGLAL